MTSLFVVGLASLKRRNTHDTSLGTALAVLTLTASSLWAAPPPGIALVGKGWVPGNALDKSGLTGNICQQGVPANCVSKALFGGFGSALTYTGHNNVYVAAPDRGPFDDLTDVPYLDRVHFLHVTTNLGAPFPNIQTTLLDTRLLRNERSETLVGAAGAFDTKNERATLRFDPEGIRVGLFGTLFISDEYGPLLLSACVVCCVKNYGGLAMNAKPPKRFGGLIVRDS